MNASKDESAHKEVHEKVKTLSLSIAFDDHIFLTRNSVTPMDAPQINACSKRAAS